MFRSITKFMSCLACFAAFAMLLAACGGAGSSDAQQIRQLYPAAMSALSQHKWSELCSDTTGDQRARIIARVQSDGLSANTCAQALTKLSAANPSWAAAVRLLHNVKVQSVSVHGNQATAQVVDSYHGQSFVDHQAFIREGGRWVLNRTPSG